MMYKIRTAQIREEIYYSLVFCKLFQEGQNWCHRGKIGTNDLWFIDKHILKKPKWGRRSIDYKKTNHMIPQTWIIEFENFQNIRQNHKLRHECYRKLENGTDSRKSKPSWDKSPKRHLLERLASTTAVSVMLFNHTLRK